MRQIKAPIAGNSKAIAKIGNAELAHFTKQMLIHELIRGSLNILDVSLQLLCTSKSGTLSRVIREIILLGLQYKHHQTVTCSEFHGFSFRFEQGGLIVSIKP
jgi:hypothetical protein